MTNRTFVTLTEDSTSYEFVLAPTGQGGRGYSVEPTPLEAGEIRWRKALHPWSGGLGLDRLTQSKTYAKANADASNANELVPPPKLTTLTLTNSVTPTEALEFDGMKFFMGGRYLYYATLDGNYTVVEDKDFGVGNAATDMAVFNNELIVAMGETVRIWKRSIGVNASGTANAAVTTTDTTLTDTRLALTVNAYIGATVTCNGKTLVVTSNTATTFTGAAWSGGLNPGNGFAWSVAGTWTQATDAVYAIALGVVDNKLWRAETTNRLSNCLTTPLTLTNWSPTGTNRYTVGDSTFAVHTLLDYGGVVWAIKGDGVYQADPATRFHNQTPQMRRNPNADNGKGAFIAHGFLWAPAIDGLYQISLGRSVPRGPEVTFRPDFRFWTRGGVEWGRNTIYLLCTDEGATSNTFICKMVRDQFAETGYVYHEFVRLGATTKGYFIGASGKPTNPTIFAGLGNNAVYFKLGRGGGRDIDDPNYNYGAAYELETGPILPGPSMEVLASLVGVTVVVKNPHATNDTLAISAGFDDQSYTNLLDTQEGGGAAPIGQTTNFESVTRYAANTARGQFLKVKLTGTADSASAGTTRPSVREAYAFGYLHPKQSDKVDLGLYVGVGTRPGGIRSGRTTYEDIQLIRRWKDNGTALIGVVPGYEESTFTTRFFVTNWRVTEAAAFLGPGVQPLSEYIVFIELRRVDLGSDYDHS